MAFPTGWSHKVAITIDKDDIDADLTNWTLVFDESFDSVLTQVDGPLDADGSRASINGGGDVRFSSDSAGNTQLPCDIRDWTTNNTPGSATCEVAVRISSVSSSNDTTIYMWWGKSGESQPGAATTYGQYNAYDSHYQSVWIFDTDPSGTAPQLIDRTSTGLDLTTAGSMTSGDLVDDGPIGKAWDFDGSNDEAKASQSRDESENSIEVVAKTTSADIGTYRGVYSNASGSDTGSYQISSTDGDWDIRNKITGVSNPITIATGDDTDWHYMGYTYDNTVSSFKPFYDGVMGTEDTGGTGNIIAERAAVGVNRGDNYWFNGRVSEIRLSDEQRADAWIGATYDNIFNTSGFLSWGTIQDIGGGVTVEPSALDGVGILKDPTISASANVQVSVDTLAALGILKDPTVTGETGAVSVTVLAELLDGLGVLQDPTISAVKNVFVSLDKLDGVAELKAPTIAAIKNAIATVDALNGLGVLRDPTIVAQTAGSIVVQLDALQGIGTLQTPTLIAQASIVIQPETLGGLGVLKDPIILPSRSVVVQPSVLQGLGILRDLNILGVGSILVSLDTLTGVAEIKDPTITTQRSALVTLDALQGIGTLKDVSVLLEGGIIVTLDVLNGVAVLKDIEINPGLARGVVSIRFTPMVSDVTFTERSGT